MQIKTRAKNKKIAKTKGKAKETAMVGTQAQNDTPLGSPGHSLGTEGPSRPQRILHTHAPSNANPPLELDPAMDTDTDEPGDCGSDVDEEAAFTGCTSIRKGSKKNKENQCCLDPKDPANFLKLASALNIFLSDMLTDTQVNEADDLIQEYNIELIKVGRTPRTQVFAVLNFIHSALWSRCNKAESPLLNPLCRVYMGFWPCCWLLDIHLRTPEQDPEEPQAQQSQRWYH